MRSAIPIGLMVIGCGPRNQVPLLESDFTDHLDVVTVVGATLRASTADDSEGLEISVPGPLRDAACLGDSTTAELELPMWTENVQAQAWSRVPGVDPGPDCFYLDRTCPGLNRYWPRGTLTVTVEPQLYDPDVDTAIRGSVSLDVVANWVWTCDLEWAHGEFARDFDAEIPAVPCP